MNILNLIGERVLLKIKGRYGWQNDDVTEYKVLEVSPSGNWVKLMSIYGNKFWKPLAEVSYIEKLVKLVKIDK